MNFYVWTKKKAPNLYQLGANDNEKKTLIDCTSASAVFFYQIKSFVSILEDESARFFAVSKSNSNADRNRGKTGVFFGEFIVDKPVAINNIVEEIRKFAINKRNWTIKNNVLCCLRRECLLPYFWPDARKQKHSLNRQCRMAGLLRPWIPLHSRNWLFTAVGPTLKLLRWTGTRFTPTFTISYSKIDGCNKQLDAIVTAAEKSDVVLFGTTDYYYWPGVWNHVWAVGEQLHWPWPFDSAFNDTLWNIATGDLTTVQDAEKDFEERLASYNAAQNSWAAWQSWIVTGCSYNWIKNRGFWYNGGSLTP